MEKFYGILERNELSSDKERHLENLSINGFSVLKGVLSAEKVSEMHEAIERVYKRQVNEFGLDDLVKINELDMVRAPLAYDDLFIDLLIQERVKEIIDSVLGDHYMLHLQNAIINRPNISHHQASWHRDLPYQNFIISSPIAVNAFYCLSPFNVNTGGTMFLPFSHRLEKMPSAEFLNENRKTLEAEAGDVIIFDSMLFHRAGSNTSNLTRIGVNQVFVKPILRQQIDLPHMLRGKFSQDPYLRRLLGYDYQTQASVINYRQSRIERITNP